MFGPWFIAFGWIKGHFPKRMSSLKLHFNFIIIHCEQSTFFLTPAKDYFAYFGISHPTDLYILGWAIVGSILMYPAGGMAYIDALYFASGAATQSGLNP